MSTKTVSLSEDAYERLKRLKRENESFSDVIRRITGKVDLKDFHGILSEETSKEIEKKITERRENHRETHNKNIQNIAEELKK